MPNYTGVSKIHPTFVRPYTFDILNAVLYALNDPEQYAIFMKHFYDSLSTKFKIVRFEEMPRYISVEIEKDDSVFHVDVEDFVRKQFAYSVINCFSKLLNTIPGFRNISGGEALSYINSSFPILSLPYSSEDNPVYHICFGI